MTRRILIALGIACFLWGCDGLPHDDPDAAVDWDGWHYPPDFWDPGDKPGACDGGTGDSDACVSTGPACADSPCIHGTCRPQDGGYWCECDACYAGEHCDACAEGCHVENMECVPD